MAYVNITPDMRAIFDGLERRIKRLEQAKRFNVPYLVSDPSASTLQNGDMWYNTTTNQLKVYVNSATKIVTIT